jgi:two-component system NarL family sensor kinase
MIGVKRLIILLLLLTSALQDYGQSIQQALDSANYYRSRSATRTISFAQQAYSKAKKTQQHNAIGESAFMLGVGNYLNGDRNTALRWYLEAEQEYSIAKDTAGMIRVYSELCILLLKQNKIPDAHKAIDQGIALAGAINNTDLLGTAYNNKGLAFMDAGQNDSAIYYYTKAYNKYKEISNDKGMAYSLGYMASAETHNTGRAMSYLQESATLLAKAGDKYGEAVAINNMGELLLQQHEPSKALTYFTAALKKSDSLKFDDLADNIYAMSATCYSQLGDYKRAYYAAQKHIALHEKIAGEHLLKQTEELHTRYETGKKEQQNILLKEQNSRQAALLSRNRILTGAIAAIALLVVSILYLFYNRHKLKREAEHKEELFAAEKQRADAIIDAEENERRRLARELHDGIGQTLAATRRKIQLLQSALIANGTINESVALIDDAIKEVRQLSHNMMPPWLRNKTLDQAVEELAYRLQDTTDITVHTGFTGMDKLQLDKLQALMLYRSIQEVTSNIVRHAAATEMHIELVNHEKELTIMIYDNGKGFNKNEVLHNGTGIGIKNIISRVTYIGGETEIDTQPGNGTTYTINLPLAETI